jgi:hypothetical protein
MRAGLAGCTAALTKRARAHPKINLKRASPSVNRGVRSCVYGRTRI